MEEAFAAFYFIAEKGGWQFCNLFESPYFQSRHGSGVITIRKGDRKLVVDFNSNTVSKG